MGFSDKLRFLLNERGMKAVDLARATKLSEAIISEYLSGKKEPRGRQSAIIADVLNVSMDSLWETRFSKNLMKAKQDPQIPPHYSRLHPRYRAVVDAAIEEAYAQQEAAKEARRRAKGKNDNRKVIPIRASYQAASAGHGFDLGPESFYILYIIDDGSIDPNRMFCVPVEGDSMEPRFHDGDMLVIEQGEGVDEGEIGLFTVGNQGYVKKKGDGELLSLNPKYNPIPIPRDEYFGINGRVIDVLDPELIVDEIDDMDGC